MLKRTGAVLFFCAMVFSLPSCSTVGAIFIGPEKYEDWADSYPNTDGKDEVVEKEALDLIQNFYNRKKIPVIIVKVTHEWPDWKIIRNSFGIITRERKYLAFLGKLTKEIKIKEPYMLHDRTYKMPAGTYFWGDSYLEKEYVGGTFEKNGSIDVGDYLWPEHFHFIHDDLAKKILAQK